MLGVEGLRRAGGRKAAFAKIPEFVQVDGRLVGCDLRLLARLIHYAWGSGVCWPSVRRLAADLSVSERTVQVALGRLYKLGYVATRRAGNPTGREFVLSLEGAQPPAPPGVTSAAPPGPTPAAPQVDSVPSTQIQSTQIREARGAERNEPIHEGSPIIPPCPAAAEPKPEEAPRPASPLRCAAGKAEHEPAPASRRTRAGRMSGEELAAMTRALAESGDPAAQRELARLERPRPEPAPAPTTVADLIDRLDDDPTFRPRLAAALSDHWGDRKSYEFYWQVAMREPREVISRAFAGCRMANSPPAMFTALIRRDPASRTRP